MTASLLFQTLLRRSVALMRWTEVRNPPPPTDTFDGDDEPDSDPEQPFWAYFIENPRPTSTDRNNTN